MTFFDTLLICRDRKSSEGAPDDSRLCFHQTNLARMTSKTTPASRRSDIPPIVHALGGSIGSALALLLFYPLERARIEIQSKAAASHESSMVESLSNFRETEISPIRRAANETNNLVIGDEDSWDRANDSPTSASWSMNSCTIDDESNAVSSIHHLDDDDSSASFDINEGTEGIFRCLLDLCERGVLYKGVKPIISTIFTRCGSEVSVDET